MFRFFKRNSKLYALERKHKRLLKEAYQLSTVNRLQSDLKYAEAQEVLDEIKALERVQRAS